jgi:F0F1-type ATP synthase membrane subunit b/b'
MSFIYLVLLVLFFLRGRGTGVLKKKLAEIETDLKEVKSDKYDIIDKLARIETKLDYLNKEK